MTYEIEVLPAAERGLRMVHPQMRARIRGAVLKLATDPRPPGARALKDRPSYLRETGVSVVLTHLTTRAQLDRPGS